MKNIFKLVLIITLTLYSKGLKAQSNISDFTLTSNVVHSNDNNIDLSSTITKTENLLTWQQLNDGYSEEFSYSIASSSGSWDTATSTGNLIYSLTSEGYDCELTLAGQENELTATLIYFLSDSEDETYTFEINSITYH